MPKGGNENMSSKRILSVFVVVLVLGVAGWFLANVPGAEVPLARSAACQSANTACPYGDIAKTSALEVDHGVVEGINFTPVEPDDGETWLITAYWNTPYPSCLEYSETASVVVSWTGSSWSTSNVTTTTNITAISVCTTDTCQAEDTHSYTYKLIVDVNDPVSTVYHLRKVNYALFSADDGYELDTEECELGNSVTFLDDFAGTDDTGYFNLARCPFTCDVSGASAVLHYE
jgi:hypothetical protein